MLSLQYKYDFYPSHANILCCMPMEIVFKNTMNDKNKLTKVSFLSPNVILVPCPLMHLLPVVKRKTYCKFCKHFFWGGRGRGRGLRPG